jgi:CRP-like cAMP-binding protein
VLYQEKLNLLKSMLLLKRMPERSLKALAEFLKPRELADGTVVFEEGARGMSLYFLATGRIRISKGALNGATKELAVLAPGDFFGEMAILDAVPRSATATSVGPSLVFELFRDDLTRWSKASPLLAVQFYTELGQVQSKRLRRASRELTLHFDLDEVLSDSKSHTPEFLADALERVVSHLGGSWSAAAYVGEHQASMKRVSSHGNFHFDDFDALVGTGLDDSCSWLNDVTFHAPLTRRGKTIGNLLFRAPTAFSADERADLALTLKTVCTPIAAGLEVIKLRDGNAPS